MIYGFYIFIFSVLLASVPTLIHAQKNQRFELGIKSDNDAFLFNGQDRYYTNGIEFYIRKAIPFHSNNTSLKKRTWLLYGGQRMYTAHSGHIHIKEQIDRPITGYLYGGGEVSWFYDNESLFTFGAEVGIIGPSAYGEKIQEGYHKLFNFYTVKGWDYQLNNALGFDIRSQFSRILFRNGLKNFDGFFNSIASVGTNNTNLSFGSSFRYGKFNKLFESAETGARVSMKNEPVKEFYIFYRPQLSWVIYDSTMQGGMFLKDKGSVTYNPKPIVFSQIVGMYWTSFRVGINVQYVFNTKEIQSEAAAHQYGSLNIAYYF